MTKRIGCISGATATAKPMRRLGTRWLIAAAIVVGSE